MFNLFKKSKKTIIYAPISGQILNIEQVPDEVFSKKMVGDGVAIIPSDGEVKAPCDGKIIQIFPTNHALGIETADGIEILIHLGIDTVELKGNGFERFAEEGKKVKRRDLLMKMDLDLIKQNGKSVITPIIITNMERVNSLETKKGKVKAGESVIFKIKNGG